MKKTLIAKDKLERCITDCIAPFGLTAKLDTDFAYYYVKDLVTFSIFSFKGYDDFMLDAESRFPYINGVSPFIWSLLHEIGHHETWDELTEEELKESAEIKESINEKDHSSRMAYFTCPDEYAATDWAGHYIESHRDKIDEFWDKVLVELYDFYVSNNITDF
jgi:hypothetical protein